MEMKVLADGCACNWKSRRKRVTFWHDAKGKMEDESRGVEVFC